MKKIVLLLSIWLLIFGCSNNSDNDVSSESPVVELEVSPSGDAITSRRVEGRISTVGEVDRYHLNLVETGRILQIKCTSDTLRSDVDLLVHIFEVDANGNLNMIAGTHAPDDAIQPADLKINIYIDRPKELYVHVRDYMDNEASDNPYYIMANYEAAPDGNGTFETAVSLTPGGAAQEEAIGTIGDVDCFSFSVSQSGVYDVFIDFNPISGTDVRLSMDLYGPDGTLIETRDQGNSDTTHMVHYLPATGSGETYMLVVDDDGKDDFDAMSVYTVSVSQNSVTEANTNDTPATASTSVSNASIDYYEDIDWYKLSVSASGNIDIMELEFDSDINITYRLSLYVIADGDVAAFNSNDETPVYTHDFSGGVDPEYHAVLKLDELDPNEYYYLAVQSRSGASVTGNSPYTLSVVIDSIVDPDEAGDGNNIDSNAIDISATPSHIGKIGYRGDVDWFEVTISPLSAADRVFRLYLDIPSDTDIEYAVDIIRESRSGEDDSYDFNKTIRHTSSTFRAVDLKTGFIIPKQTDGNTDATYLIKVYDFQNDDGEDREYTLSWGVDTIPGAPAAGVSGSVTYNDEQQERDESYTANYTGKITITYTDDIATFEYPEGTSFTYRLHNAMLNLSSGTSSTVGDTTTIIMPWVSGYIDYQGDEDWYAVDLSNPFIPTDTDWYYEIGVELIANNSAVEYVWDYFPDTDNFQDPETHFYDASGEVCQSGATTCADGIAANGGDLDIAVSYVDSTFPLGDSRDPETPWIGSMDGDNSWKGVVFFRISDFNYMYLDEDTINPSPDDDWGFDAPYFFQVTLTYHSGDSSPSDD